MPDDKPHIAAEPPSEMPGSAKPTTAVSAAPLNLPSLPPEVKPTPKSTAPPVPAKKEPEVKDTFRELIETVVFVVVLVLMLKTFLAEAFVIPTGSMADTLLGYHYKRECEQCKHMNWINASSEAEPPPPPHQAPRIVRFVCENCWFANELRPELAKGLQP